MGCEQLDRPRSTREAGKEDSVPVRVVASENVVNNCQQITLIIDRQCARREEMRPGSLHFPESDVASVRRPIGLCWNRFGKHHQKSIAIGLTDPVKFLRGRFRRTANATKHEDHCGMRSWMNCPMNDVRPAVPMMSEWPYLGLRCHTQWNRHQQGGQQKEDCIDARHGLGAQSYKSEYVFERIHFRRPKPTRTTRTKETQR